MSLSLMVPSMATERACRLPHRLLATRRPWRHSREGEFQITAEVSWHPLVGTNQFRAVKGSMEATPPPRPVPQTVCAPVNKRSITIKTDFFISLVFRNNCVDTDGSRTLLRAWHGGAKRFPSGSSATSHRDRGRDWDRHKPPDFSAGRQRGRAQVSVSPDKTFHQAKCPRGTGGKR